MTSPVLRYFEERAVDRIRLRTGSVELGAALDVSRIALRPAVRQALSVVVRSVFRSNFGLIARAAAQARGHKQRTSCSAHLVFPRKGNFSWFMLRGVGVRSSWVEYRAARWLPRLKTTDRIVRSPTKWSDQFSRTSLLHCGPKIRPQILLRSSTATCAPSNGISRVRANGPATPSPQSFLKFSRGTQCAT